MKLKIFVPDFEEKIDKKNCVPPLYPFVSDETPEKKIEKYGKWFINVQIVDTIEKSDIVMPAHCVNYYYLKKKRDKLFQINKSAHSLYKLTICWTNGDWGVT